MELSLPQNFNQKCVLKQQVEVGIAMPILAMIVADEFRDVIGKANTFAESTFEPTFW